MMKRIFPIIAILLSFFCTDVAAIIRYATNNLNLRYEANASAYVLTVIPKGTAITIDEDCDCQWVPVEYNGYTGYISTKYLSKSPVQQSHSKKFSSSSHRTGGVKYYTNTRGHRVQSPTHYNSRPSGATALCNDGTYSFSQGRRGTCSHHGGVARWY